MTWKRVFAVSILVLAIGSTRVGVRAQDTPPETPTPPEEQVPAPTAPPAEEPTGPGFWGDRFALYIEAGGGTGSAEVIDSTIETTTSQNAVNAMDLSDMLNGRVAVGWKLPVDHGSFRIVFTGHSEESYEFTGTGNTRAVAGNPTQPNASLPWWHVSISDGTLTSTLIPPTWVDLNGDSAFTNDEIQYFPGASPTPGVRTVPDTAQNRLQTWDFLYLRDFGGRTVSGDYSCGIRYLLYDGNVPAAAWLNSTSGDNAAGGFTEGTNLHLLSFNQETRGYGPTGSLGLQWHLFRNRLVLFGESRFAFLSQNMHVDSGNFFTLVTNPASGTSVGYTQAIPARLDQEVTKSTWNFGGALGARVNVVQGFHVDLAIDRTSYHDAVLLPFSITIPGSAEQAPFRSVALYQTQNVDLDLIRLSLGFQF